MLNPALDRLGSSTHAASNGRARHAFAYFVFRAAAKLIQHLWERPRNAMYGAMLDTQNFSTGSRARFKGLRGIHVGANFHALDRLWLETIENGDRYHPSLTIGTDVTCSDSVHIAATHRVSIGNHVLIGSRVIITDHNHGLYHGPAQSPPEQNPRDRMLDADGITIVEDKVWLGDGVVVLPGAVIGRGSVIGANSVVLGVIPPHSIAVGSPARVVRTYDTQQQAWSALQTRPRGPA